MLPSKYQARLPLPLKVLRDYGEYAADYKLQGSAVMAERRLSLRQLELPVERLQDYQALQGRYHLGIIAEKRGQKEAAIRLYAQSTAALTTVPEARAGLARLAAPNSIPTLLETAKKELREYNTLTLGQLLRNLNTPVEAEFYLVFVPDSTRNSRVDDVKFIRGAESLKSLGPVLKTIKYQLIFPNNSPTKIIRRGALLCLPKPGACTFTMVSPDLITSVD